MSIKIRDDFENLSTKFFGPHNLDETPSKGLLCEWFLFYKYFLPDDFRYRFEEKVVECAEVHYNIRRDDFMDLVKRFESNKLLIRHKLYKILLVIYDLQVEYGIDSRSRFVCEILKKCLDIIGLKSEIHSGTVNLKKIGETPHHWIKVLGRIIDITHCRTWENHFAKVSSEYKSKAIIDEPGMIERYIITADKDSRNLYFRMLSVAEQVSKITRLAG